ncbi:MAG: electron transfer flavoprotein subunit alpha [Lachnospiraceae bacterium]|nr:electron transfer flavoprotein subunit alpha [Lachnospiraceae bacterium]
MPELRIHQEKVTEQAAQQLIALCPFSAISYEEKELRISSACKMCRMCVRKGPEGVVEYINDEPAPTVCKEDWKGIAVFADSSEGRVHPVTFELIGKAKELAKVTNHPVCAVLITDDASGKTEDLLRSGVDKVFVYEDPMFRFFSNTTYANAFADFIEKEHPSSVLVGATNVGRSLAPRIACRFRTGLTADCTALEMKPNTDLVQIRPAFGGNIMAQIISTKTRPQFATVRYKVFSAPALQEDPSGEVVSMKVDPAWEDKRIRVEDFILKPAAEDISEAEVIVAVGRGLKSKADIDLARELAELMGAKLACTRPLVEAGWLDASHQIGLSGKTVKPKLIFTFGISGAVQFAAGMKSSDCIIAVNTDPEAPIFSIAQYNVIGDLYEILPEMISMVKEAKHV